jgi:GntR family transcriptional repressor for pyruvate dehydrogenase complex
METGQFSRIGNKDRLVDRVVSEIQDHIVSGLLAPGTMLPPERQLADQLGVSRTVIREAVQVLVARGLLESRHGIGNIVQMLGSDQLSEPLNIMLRSQGFSLDHLHQVRSMLEVENAGFAAVTATQDEMENLQQVIDQMASEGNDPQAFAELDAEFHHILAKMSHNPLLVTLLDSLGGLMREVRLTVSHYPDLFITVVPDHRRILENVRNRDAHGARQAMQAHLDHALTIQQHFLEDRKDRNDGPKPED